jgi:ribosomal protein L2
MLQGTAVTPGKARAWVGERGRLAADEDEQALTRMESCRARPLEPGSAVVGIVGSSSHETSLQHQAGRTASEEGIGTAAE